MTGQRVGYVRVSTLEQNEARQLEGVAVDRTFTDKASGKDTNRPQLAAALAYVREGDTLVVHSLDRLARNLTDLRTMVAALTSKGIAVEFVKERLTFTGDDNAMSVLMMSIMGAVAEFERSLIRERQAEGIAIAKRNGVYKGRKAKLTSEQAIQLREQAQAGVSKALLARRYGINRDTVYAYLNQQAAA